MSARALKRVFPIAIAALALPVPLLVQVMQSGLVAPSVSADGWLGVPLLGAIHAATGMTAVVQLWLLAAMVGAAGWAVPAGFEQVVRRLRIDPGDNAWTSLAWALHSWRGALRWFAVVFLPTMLVVLVLAALLWGTHLAVVSALLEGGGVVQLAFLALPFFVLDARNYALDHPARRWSARWPAREVWFLCGAVLAVDGLVWLFVLPHRTPWISSDPPTSGALAAMIGSALAALLFSLLVSWSVGLAWLSRAGWVALPAIWRRGFQPRVLAVVAVQWARPTMYVLLALLPLLAGVWLFVEVVPQAEESLRNAGCCEQGGFWPPMVDVSRHLVAWWWAYLLGAVNLLSLVVGPSLRWFVDVAWARLMLELGVVDAALATASPAP